MHSKFYLNYQDCLKDFFEQAKKSPSSINGVKKEYNILDDLTAQAKLDEIRAGGAKAIEEAYQYSDEKIRRNVLIFLRNEAFFLP